MTIDTIRKVLGSAKESLRMLSHENKRLSEPPGSFGVVLQVCDSKAPTKEDFEPGIEIVYQQRTGTIISVESENKTDRHVLVQYEDDSTEALIVPDGIHITIPGWNNGTVTLSRDMGVGVAALPSFKLKRGDIVILNRNGQIISIYDGELPGDVVYVDRVINEKFIEIAADQGAKILFNGKGKIEKGDRIVVDRGMNIVLKNLGKETSAFLTEVPGLTWDEIGGLEEAKMELREAIELPFERPDLFVRYGKRPIKGVLLYGPPGCGKTLLGRAAATSIARLHGKSGAGGFIYVKGPEVLSRFVGSAEATIRGVFQNAKEHYKKTGFPAVIFIDEADAILSRRGTGISSDMEKTIVPTFLTEMDGAEESGAIVFLATNRSDVLDPAIVRDRRIDRKIRISRPDRTSSIEIFKLALAPVPMGNGDSIRGIAEKATEELFHVKWSLYSIELQEDEMVVTLGDLISGGMIVNIVDHATSYAMRREMADGVEGMTLNDITKAIQSIYDANKDLSHQDALTELTADFADQVKSVKRLRQA